MSHYTRFNERVFIADKKSRCLLKDFCAKGITAEELLVLEELVAIHAPSLLPLLQVLKNQINTLHPVSQCPKEWSGLITALACPSPVCGLLHPSDRLSNLLKKITDDDFTSNPLNMEILQQEVPVLFELLRNVTHLPKKAMTSLIKDLIDKANAAFRSMESESAQAVMEDPLQEFVLLSPSTLGSNSWHI